MLASVEPAQVLDRPFQQAFRWSVLPPIDAGGADLNHQLQSLQVIRAEQSLVGAQGRDHAVKFGFHRRHHALPDVISSSVAYIVM